MKIFRVIEPDGTIIKYKYIMVKNKKQAKELAIQNGYSNFMLYEVQPEDASSFWRTLSELEQNQFKKALINNFFKEEVL